MAKIKIQHKLEFEEGQQLQEELLEEFIKSIKYKPKQTPPKRCEVCKHSVNEFDSWNKNAGCVVFKRFDKSIGGCGYGTVDKDGVCDLFCVK